MGSQSSKPVRSAANTISRRQYPKQPSAPTTAAPNAAQNAAEPESRTAPSSPSPPPPFYTSQKEPQTSQGPVVHSKEEPSSVKSDAIDLDGRDPHFAASLRSIGPVTPAPTYSHSSTFKPSPTIRPSETQPVFPQATSNPALLVLSARQRITKAAEQEAEEVGRPSFKGREFVDALTIRQALAMRDKQGLAEEEIESMLRLKRGIVGRLGRRGIVEEAS